VATIVAGALRIPLVALLPHIAPVYAPFFIAVTVSAWYGGLGPGLFSIGLSLLLARLLPPYPVSPDTAAAARAAIFVSIAGAFAFFSELLHRSRREAVGERERRATSEDQLRETLAARATELAHMARLHEMSNRMVRSDEPEALLLDLVDTAIAVSGAEKGNIQLLDGDVLRLAASRGFEQPFLDYFDAVDGACTACGTAVVTGERVLVEDLETSPLLHDTPELEVLRGAGVRALQSTPLYNRRGELVGMVSTHYPKPTRPGEADLHALDLLGRQAADWIERIRAQDALQRVSEQLRIVIDSMSVAVTRCTRDLRYAWVSRPYAAWRQLAPEQIVGHAIEEILGPAAMESLRPYFDRVLSGEVVRYEEEVAFAGIGLRWIRAVYTPTRDAAGLVDGWVAVVMDIHDLKQAEHALRAEDTRKEVFLATLAHELRNPMAPLRNALEILKRPEATPRVAEEARAAMERQLSHAIRLVDDLIDVSRISRDALELRLEKCDLRSVIAQAVENVRPFLEAGGHRLTVDVPDEPLDLRADPVRMAQVVANLLHNACKFSEAGGPIAVAASARSGWIELTVRDEGIGFPSEENERIFEMFTQLDRSLSRSRGGLGVGLSLVRRLVEMHGGRVEASSGGAGRGALFRVTLPEARVAAGNPPAFLRIPPARNGERRRILVVDDNVDSASSLATLLELSGHETRTVHDGLSAVEETLAFAPDVVLLDLGLPGIDGYEAARRIRTQPDGRSILIIAVTGWGQEEDRRRSREAGFDHHMVKPLRAAALEHLLASSPRRAQTPRGLEDPMPGSQGPVSGSSL
jgi:PAS domain S-box-containing protein